MFVSRSHVHTQSTCSEDAQRSLHTIRARETTHAFQDTRHVSAKYAPDLVLHENTSEALISSSRPRHAGALEDAALGSTHNEEHCPL